MVDIKYWVIREDSYDDTISDAYIVGITSNPEVAEWYRSQRRKSTYGDWTFRNYDVDEVRLIDEVPNDR